MTAFRPKEKERLRYFELSCFKKNETFCIFFNKCVHVIRPFDIRIYSIDVTIAAEASDSILTFSLMIRRRFGLIHYLLGCYYK